MLILREGISLCPGKMMKYQKYERWYAQEYIDCQFCIWKFCMEQYFLIRIFVWWGNEVTFLLPTYSQYGGS